MAENLKEQPATGITPQAGSDTKQDAGAALYSKPNESEATPQPEKDANEQPKKETEGKPDRAIPSEYTLTVPDGATLEEAELKGFKEFAKENGFTNDEAQRILNRDIANRDALLTAQHDSLAEAQKGWIESTKTDKEIGGPDFPKNMELAKRVVDKYGTDEFKKALNDSGLGNHPELIRVFTRIGKLMGEDSLVKSPVNSGARKQAHEILYPNSGSK